MKLLVLQHVPFEGPAAIKDWAHKNNHNITHHCCSNNSGYPPIASFDCLIIMGGPMGVNDGLPWMTPELAFIRSAIAANKFMLGICLGAQLIAVALNAKIHKNPQREIGWFPVHAVTTSDTASKMDPASRWMTQALPPVFNPLHWHGDTFEIPEGAQHLFYSEGCSNQAFIAKDRIVGLQFHLEFDKKTAARVAEACPKDLEGGKYVQTLGQILSEEQLSHANQLMFSLLDALHEHFKSNKCS